MRRNLSRITFVGVLASLAIGVTVAPGQAAVSDATRIANLEKKVAQMDAELQGLLVLQKQVDTYKACVKKGSRNSIAVAFRVGTCANKLMESAKPAVKKK